MKLIKKILQRLSGYQYPQEYLCLEDGLPEQGLHVYIIANNIVIRDVTNFHLFVGYKPLIFAFPNLEGFELKHSNQLHLEFSNSIFTPGAHVSDDGRVARLALKKGYEIEVTGSKIYFFEGVHGTHQFLSPLNQWAIQFNNEWFNKKAGNVFLAANLYRQVQIAYAIPRKISLISVKQNDAFNLFPTDLHGKLNDDIYIISLRHEGLAAKQVESTKKILLSQIPPSAYKTAYSLGKNHMQPLKTKDQFPFSEQFSEKFGIPVPNQANGYYELTLEASSIHGIHRLFIFSITTNKTNPALNSLVHIHNAYATWRKKKGLSGNYLLR
jgi:hypothetical protein